MNELNAFIEAKTLKRVIGVLAKIDDEAVFTIEQDRLSCRIIDGDNALLAMIRIPSEAFDLYVANPCRVGVDLNWMMAILNVTPDDAEVNMIIDKDETPEYGLHVLSSALIGLDRVRKPPEDPRVQWDATMQVTGEFFKQMIDYLMALNADRVMIEETSDNVMFYSHHNYKINQNYKSEADCLTEYASIAKSEYSIDYLADIAAGINTDDTVHLRFGGDMPLEIRYVVDGCEIEHILAPRIGDD